MGDVRVTTHEVSPVIRRLEVEVDPARVRKAFERAYRDLAKRARVRGFRPGKTPRAVLEKMFGGQVREEIERLLVSESLPEAVEEADIRPVTEPAIEAQPPEADTPFRYSAQVEVKPTIELPTLEGLPGKRPAVDVSDAEVLQELENLRERHAQLLDEDEDVEAADGHILRVDFVGRIDGEPFEGGSGQDVSVELGSDRFIPGFAEQLIGTRAGQDTEVRVSFPEDYGNGDLAGREATFSVHVAAVQRREFPELDDEFAKDLGDFEDLAALRTRVREDMVAQRERTAEGELRRSVVDSLIERTEFDVPPGLTERRLESQLQRAHRELADSMPDDALHRQIDAWRESWRPQAEREVREALLLEAVAAAQGVEASDEELEARVQEMAEAEGMDSQRLRQAYREGDMMEALRVQLLDEKALAFLCAEAKIEADPDT